MLQNCHSIFTHFIAFLNKSFLIWAIINLDILSFSTLKKDVERWLQVMLEWDPKKRGRYQKTSAFTLLKSILQKKVLVYFTTLLNS